MPQHVSDEVRYLFLVREIERLSTEVRRLEASGE